MSVQLTKECAEQQGNAATRRKQEMDKGGEETDENSYSCLSLIYVSSMGTGNPLPDFGSARDSHIFSYIHDFVSLSAPD